MSIANGRSIFNPLNPDGTPASPRLDLAGQWADAVQKGIAGVQGGLIAFETKALLDADLAHANGTLAVVYGDSDPDNNTTYKKSGASGSGSWGVISELDLKLIFLTNNGDGTANAVQATTTRRQPEQAIYVLEFTHENTNATTLSINGGTAQYIKTSLGADVPAGYLVVGLRVLLIDDGTDYVLLSYGDASAVQAAAEAAQGYAEDAQDAAEAAQLAAEVAAASLGVGPFEDLRERILTSKTFYVRDAFQATPGNDSTGDGSSGAPYLTVQKAVDEAMSRDLGTNAFIILGAGTFDENVVVDGAIPGQRGSNTFLIRSENGDPDTFIVQPTSTGNGFEVVNGGALYIQNLSYGGAVTPIYAENTMGAIAHRGGYLKVFNVKFLGATRGYVAGGNASQESAALIATDRGSIEIAGNVEVVDGADVDTFINCQHGSYFSVTGSVTFTFSGTLNINTIVYGRGGGAFYRFVSGTSVTWDDTGATWSYTPQAYFLSQNAHIQAINTDEADFGPSGAASGKERNGGRFINQITGRNLIVTTTRDVSLTTDQIISTIGFKPRFGIIIASVATAGMASIGFFGDSVLYGANMRNSGAITSNLWTASDLTGNGRVIDLVQSASDLARATIKSFDDDGLTLDWSGKAGSPSGTARITIGVIW